MKDIVLVSSPPGWQNTLPIGLGFLAAYIKRDFSSVVYDIALHKNSGIQEEDYEYLWGLKAKNIWLNPEVLKLFTEKYDKEIQGWVNYILSFDPRVVGFSVIHSKQLITLELIRRIKAADPSVIVITGGPACFYNEDRHLLEAPKTIDIFAIGEGEQTLYETLKSIKANKKLEQIEGAKTLKSNYSQYIPRDPIGNLDDIPFPEYPGLDFEDYRSTPVPLFWSRGCFGRCSFCEIKNVWPLYRMRSAENIFEEIRLYLEKKNVSRFSVFDSIMNGRPKTLEKVCDLIIQSGYRVHWEGNILSLPQMNDRIYSKMKDAGCALIYFGIESGSDYILKRMGKSFTIKEVERNIRIAHDAGIEISLNFITGFPGEGEKEFTETVDFVRRNRRWIDRIDFITECQVARGTHLFSNPDEYDIVIPENWEGYRWYAKDGKNNISVRQERTLRLGRLAESLGIKIDMNFNLDDGNRDIMTTISENLKKLDKRKNSVFLTGKRKTSPGPNRGLADFIEEKPQQLQLRRSDKTKRILPLDAPAEVACVYLCGEDSRTHRWGAESDKGDFQKQVDALKKLSATKEIYHIVVGISRTNFYKLQKIYNLVKKLRKERQDGMPPFNIRPFRGIRIRFYRYLDTIREYVKDQGIEFKIIDPRFSDFLLAIETEAKKSDFRESVFLNSLRLARKSRSI